MTAPTPEDANPRDDEENTGIHAGYTYLGQFIDHDITFDPASSLMKQNDPDALEDFRTPRFDLDNIYGRGPDDQPYLYESDGKKLLLSSRQLTGSALIIMCVTWQEIHRIQKTQGLLKEPSLAIRVMTRMLLCHSSKGCLSGSITGWWIYFRMIH